MGCLICSSRRIDICHIKTRGSGGNNEPWNIMKMCREHHTEQHALGWWRFANKYPIVMKELNHKGWVFVDRFGLIKLVRK